MIVTDFVGKWKVLVGEDKDRLYEIYAGENDKLHLQGEGKNYPLKYERRTGSLAANVKGVDLSLSFWPGGGSMKDRILAVEWDPGRSRKPERHEMQFSTWGADRIGDPSSLSSFREIPELDPAAFLTGFWKVTSKFGKSPGLRRYVRVVLRKWPSEPEGRYLLCSAKHEEGPWKVYDEMEYDEDIGSLVSIYRWRSVTLWYMPPNDLKCIHAMYDANGVAGGPKFMAIDGLEPPDIESGVGCWGGDPG